MKLKLFTLLLYLQNVLANSTTEKSTTTPVVSTNDEILNDNYEYVIRLLYHLDEKEVPAYIINKILDADKNITTQDALSLLKVESYTMENYIDVLKKLNLSSEEVFSFTGLERFLEDTGLTFRLFYNKVLTQLNQSPNTNVRNALKSLGINTGDFSDAMAFGSDSEVLAVFKSGNFSNASLQNAAAILGTTTEFLFQNVSSVCLNQIKTLDIKNFTRILRTYGFDKSKTQLIISAFNVSFEDVYKVENCKNLLDIIVDNLNKNVTLGISTDKNKITINKKIYDQIQTGENVIKILGTSISNENVTHEITSKNLANLPGNIVELISNFNATSYIAVAENTTAALVNCSYITLKLNNTGLSIDKVTSVNRTEDVIVIPSNTTRFVLGSPLICRSRLYGMANETNSTSIIFNPIYGPPFAPVPPIPVRPHPSGEGKLFSSICVVVTNLVFYYLLIFDL